MTKIDFSKIKYVLFDLDGTLLPMDEKIFIKVYFGKLAEKMAPHGYSPDELINAVWSGVKAMVMNNTEYYNDKVFWDRFAELFSREKAENDYKYFDEFYRENFKEAKPTCGFTVLADKTVKLLKSKGYKLALATNPIFPEMATDQRIEWAGLDKNDFEFVTVYENSKSAKPNPKYYLEVAGRLGAKPDECLMVGNDIEEDGIALKTGMQVFIITDCLINKNDKDINDLPHGSFEEFFSLIKEAING